MNPSLDEQHHVRLMNAVLERADITTDELWLHYMSIGGAAGDLEISAYLHGLMSLPKFQRDLLEWAAREIIADQIDAPTWQALTAGI